MIEFNFDCVQVRFGHVIISDQNGMKAKKQNQNQTRPHEQIDFITLLVE